MIAAAGRQRPMRWVVALGALALLALLLVRLPLPAAGADLNHAGLVVRNGDGRLTYAYVAFPEPQIDGMELLKRSSIPLVSVGFGGLGEGVCELQGEGCPLAECRRTMCMTGSADPYWRYFRQTAPGEWRAMALGPSATTVHDGDIDGWSWTQDAADLPNLTLPELAHLAGAPATPPIGERSGAVVRTVGGLPAVAAPASPGPIGYAVAAVIIALIAGGALFAARHERAARSRS